MKRVRLAAAIIMASLFSAALLAQSDTASITGIVRDSSTASIPGASVVVKNEATGIERRAKTSETGLFIVSNLPPGFYTISVEAQGFKKSETTKNKLDPNIATSVDVSMEIGCHRDGERRSRGELGAVGIGYARARHHSAGGRELGDAIRFFSRS